jgi:hypothetical protein
VVVVVVVVVPPPAAAGAALLPLDAATAMPAMTAAPTATYRRVLPAMKSCAGFTPAGAPGERGATSAASAVEVDKAKAKKEESSRIRNILESSGGGQVVPFYYTELKNWKRMSRRSLN